MRQAPLLSLTRMRTSTWATCARRSAGPNLSRRAVSLQPRCTFCLSRIQSLGGALTGAHADRLWGTACMQGQEMLSFWHTASETRTLWSKQGVKEQTHLPMMPAHAAFRASTMRASSLLSPRGRGGSTLRNTCVQSGLNEGSAQQGKCVLTADAHLHKH